MAQLKATKPDKTRHPEALTPAQEQAAVLIAGGSSVTDAAATVGVHRTTVHEWNRLPAFRGLVDELRRDAMRTVADLMRANLTKAARVVAAILDSQAATDRDKLSAAAIAYKVADGLPGLAMKREEPPPTLDELAVGAARRAHAMRGGIFFPMEDERTPGTAWAKADLERVFPGSYAKLRAFGDDRAGAAAYCDELLEEWRDMLDEDAIAGAAKETRRAAK